MCTIERLALMLSLLWTWGCVQNPAVSPKQPALLRIDDVVWRNGHWNTVASITVGKDNTYRFYSVRSSAPYIGHLRDDWAKSLKEITPQTSSNTVPIYQYRSEDK